MVHGKNRIPYWIDRRLTGLAGPDYDATISFGLPFEPEDSQYGKYRITLFHVEVSSWIRSLRSSPAVLPFTGGLPWNARGYAVSNPAIAASSDPELFCLRETVPPSAGSPNYTGDDQVRSWMPPNRVSGDCKGPMSPCYCSMVRLPMQQTAVFSCFTSVKDWICSRQEVIVGSFELDKMTVSYLHGRYQKGRLDVQPDYQRSKAWSDKLKYELIDTVLNEWPMGLIMLNLDKKPDSDGKPVDHFDVVDGQQRLRCLFEYLAGVEEWARNKGKKNSRFVQYGFLSDAAQERFNGYRVSVALMNDYEADEILDVFSRLQNGRPLRIGERVKALRSPHKSYLKEVTEHGLFELEGASTHKTRDAHWNLSALFYKGIYNNNLLERQEYEHLEAFLQDNQLFDEKCARRTVANTKRTMNFLRKTIQEAIIQDAAFLEKVRSPRLMKWTFACVAMLDHDYSLTGREHLLARGLRSYHCAREEEESPEWLAYLSTGRTGRIDTDDVRVCLEHLKNRMTQTAILEPKDPQRFFSSEQRRKIFEKSLGYCALCSIELSETNFHADHILPYSQDGQTTLENGQALCAACNTKKG